MISPETYQQILSDSMDFCTNVRKIDPKESLDFIMSDGYLQSQAEFYQSVLFKLGLDPEGKKILEIGSGYGFFMVYAIAKLGWNLHGVEPGENEFSGRYEIGQDILTQNNINKERLTKATGENTHLPPGSFDIIVTHDVLEHVSDPEGVLFECARLLTPGGVLIAGMPNYRWIYEGHYNMPWFPFFSKSFAKKYVSLAGRDKSYIDSLHFLNPKMVKSIVRRISGIEVCFPLEHGGYGVMMKKVQAYLECAEQRKRGGLKLWLIRIIKALGSVKITEMGFLAWARTTGIYHEMHLVFKKNLKIGEGL